VHDVQHRHIEKSHRVQSKGNKERAIDFFVGWRGFYDWARTKKKVWKKISVSKLIIEMKVESRVAWNFLEFLRENMRNFEARIMKNIKFVTSSSTLLKSK
jgi:hypothetical protein